MTLTSAPRTDPESWRDFARKLRGVPGDLDLLREELSPDGAAMGFAHAALADPLMPPVESHLKAALAEIEPLERKSDAVICGCLGFIVLMAKLQRCAEIAQPNPPEGVDEKLRDPPVRDFFRGWYRLDDKVFDLREMSAVRIGTTSFIVSCHMNPRGRIALKCVLPRASELAYVVKTTRGYADRYRKKLGYVPKIYRSDDKWIAMEFIDGETLEDELARKVDTGGAREPLSSDRRDYVQSLVEDLGGALEDLHANDESHLDVSPSNVMRRRSGAEFGGLVLIDLGPNFAIQLGDAGGEGARRAREYVAPELKANKGLTPALADGFGLAAVTVDALTRGDDPLPLEAGIARLWEGAPTLARVVEDVTSEDLDERRFLGREKPFFREGEPGPAFLRRLSTSIVDELKTIKSRESLWSPKPQLLWNLYQLCIAIRSFDRVLEIADARRAGEQEAKRLFRYAMATVLLWRTLLVLYIVEYGATIVTAIQSQISGVEAPHIDVEFARQFAERSVALTVALVATAYYLNIFAFITTRGIEDPAARRLERCMRWSASFPIFLQLFPLLPYHVFPQFWGPTTVLAGSLITANNFLALRFIRKIEEDSYARRHRHVVTEDFLKNYGKWAWNLGAYCIVVGGAALFLAVGWAHDWYVYAVLIALAINLNRIFAQNCVGDAPRLRGGLARAVHVKRRLDALSKAAVECPEGEHERPQPRPGLNGNVAYACPRCGRTLWVEREAEPAAPASSPS